MVERQSASVVDRAVFSKDPDAYWAVAGTLERVHRIELTGRANGLPIHDTVLVSAETGAILVRLPHVHTAKDRALHDAEHRSFIEDLPGPVVRTEGQPSHADPVVNVNYDHLGTTYDAYRELFGRDSFDDRGATAISSVHFGRNLVNAFWTGTQVAFGDGDGVDADNLALSLDVTAHEITHAVTERTSNLVYTDESGGLNEAISDIFGAVVEWYRNGRVVSDAIWKVGDDIWTPGTEGDALRYMNDPALDDSSLDDYRDYVPGTDVHNSSGIANLAFYLLAQGGTHPRGKTTIHVNGIGIEKAARIFYRANTSILTPRDEFEDAAVATEQAAAQLGFSSDEVASVNAAWRAVGVAPPASMALVSGVPLTGLRGERGGKAYYRLDVPAGATDLSFQLRGGSGDPICT
ncbi:M4 family metallopeptidase [Pendulispora rubella]|uniref:Neutral metalloproteinase n=2 Tax=Pendulispora rubella TaxID=2741070 RepID=A0ABZ2L8C5_9BACT